MPAAGLLAVAFGITSLISRSVGVDEASLTVNDFTQDYVSARAWLHGENPYARTRDLLARHVSPEAAFWEDEPRHRNPHPPALILLHVPVALLPYRAARIVWLWVIGASLVAGLALVARRFGLGAVSAFAVGCGALALPVTQKLIQLIQFEAVIVLLLVLAWRALRSGRQRGAGAMLGFAAALKLYPAFMAIPLMRERRRRAIVSMVGSMLALTVGAAALAGPEAIGGYLDASSDNYRFWGAAPLNVALVSIPTRWLSRSVWWPQAVDVPALAWSLAAVAALLCVAGAATTPARMSGDPYLASIPWMVLATPLAWEYSLVLILPVALVTLLRARDRGGPSLVVVCLLAATSIGLPAGLLDPPGRVGLGDVLVGSVPTATLLGMCLAERGPPWRISRFSAGRPGCAAAVRGGVRGRR